MRGSDSLPRRLSGSEGVCVKLGFWTLYDVDWTNEEIAQRAAALGYQGVDLRVVAPGRTRKVGDNLSLDSTDEEIASTRDAFARANVEISSLNCYNGSPSAADAGAYAAFEKEIIAHAALARKMGTPRIRFQ